MNPRIDSTTGAHAPAATAGRRESDSSSTRPELRSGLRHAAGRLGIRGRLFGLAGAITALAVICVAIAVSGLVGQGNKVHAVSGAFKDFATERNAYEGWLTQDDQSNMYVALAALNDPSQRSLMAATYRQVGDGHAQALTALHALASQAADPAIRAGARSTLADLAIYAGYGDKMHGRCSRATRTSPCTT